MKIAESDLAGGESLSPAAVTSYLRTAGWQKNGDLKRGGLLRAGQFGRGDGATVLIPLMTEAPDYARLMAEAINTLAQVEGRDASLILSDLRLTRVDLVRVRRRDRHDASILLKDAPALFTGSRDLVTAATLAVGDPRPAFPGRRRSNVVAFLDSVMLAQTEPASFGVRITLPLPATTSVQPTLPGFDDHAPLVEQPFARRVSELIGVSVARARQAALSALVDGTLEQFKHEVSSGVSAELCRAIALLGSGRNDADVEISVAYGGVMARPPSAPVVFSGDAFQVLEDAARFLVDQAPRDGVEVEGLVVEMDQPITGQRRLEGNLTIGAVIDGKVRKIRVTLQEPDYRRAIEAFKEEKHVVVSGRLVLDGRQYAVEAPTDFVVLD